MMKKILLLFILLFLPSQDVYSFDFLSHRNRNTSYDVQVFSDQNPVGKSGGPGGVTCTRNYASTFEDINGVTQTSTTNTCIDEYQDGVRLGVRFEPARTNIALYSQALDTGATWISTNITIAGDALAAPDGTSTAETLTATAANGTLLQTITSASAERVFSLWLKRKTGTGNIDLTVDNGATWTSIPLGASWARYAIYDSAETNPVIGIRVVTSGDAVYAWGAQLEIGKDVTSYIPTTASSVTRPVDVQSQQIITT